MLALTVLHAFGDYAIGQTITDADTIERIRSSTNAQHVVPTNLPDPEPEPKAEVSADARTSGDEPEPAKPDAKTTSKRA